MSHDRAGRASPDYSRYSMAELQDALEHVDADRFPDRVREIEAAIASFASRPAPVVAPIEHDGTSRPLSRHRIVPLLVGLIAALAVATFLVIPLVRVQHFNASIVEALRAVEPSFGYTSTRAERILSDHGRDSSLIVTVGTPSSARVDFEEYARRMFTACARANPEVQYLDRVVFRFQRNYVGGAPDPRAPADLITFDADAIRGLVLQRLVDTGDFAAASSVARERHELERSRFGPRSAEALLELYNLAYTHQISGRLDEAAKTFDRLLTLVQGNPDVRARDRFAYVYQAARVEQDRRSYRSAERGFREALRLAADIRVGRASDMPALIEETEARTGRAYVMAATRPFASADSLFAINVDLVASSLG